MKTMTYQQFKNRIKKKIEKEQIPALIESVTFFCSEQGGIIKRYAAIVPYKYNEVRYNVEYRVYYMFPYTMKDIEYVERDSYLLARTEVIETIF